MSDNWEDGLPTSSSELGSRLGAVAKELKGQSRAAELMGVSLSQFKRYISGENHPTFEAVVALANGAKVSLSWLAGGDGNMKGTEGSPAVSAPQGGADEDLAALIADGLSKVYREENARLSPADLGRLVARIYADAMAFEDPGQRPGFVAGALGMLRRELRQPMNTESGATNSKRSA